MVAKGEVARESLGFSSEEKRRFIEALLYYFYHYKYENQPLINSKMNEISNTNSTPNRKKAEPPTGKCALASHCCDTRKESGAHVNVTMPNK